MPHRSGFVNIIGRPNVGKSTLMNALLGEKLSIVTSKAQTTRHRIIGLLNEEDCQVVFSDTPGIIDDPKYELHKAMMRPVFTSLEDADIILFIADIFEKEKNITGFLEKLRKIAQPKIMVINKIDLLKDGDTESKMNSWKQLNLFNEVIAVSALEKINLGRLKETILAHLPEHPPYYPKDELTDRNLRYFVAEIIREKIFQHYNQEIPYSCEVLVTEYQESDAIDRIRAEIYVERESQKAIVIGKKGSALKKIGMEARADIETLAGKKVFLELFVKVKPDWRNDERTLKGLGYPV